MCNLSIVRNPGPYIYISRYSTLIPRARARAVWLARLGLSVINFKKTILSWDFSVAHASISCVQNGDEMEVVGIFIEFESELLLEQEKFLTVV